MTLANNATRSWTSLVECLVPSVLPSACGKQFAQTRRRRQFYQYLVSRWALQRKKKKQKRTK
jgi:hypothetical protein